MTYSDDLKNYFCGNKIDSQKLTGHEKYTWKFLIFLEKYHLTPDQWDRHYPKGIGLIPKLQRDMIDREICEAIMYDNLNKKTGTSTTDESTNKNPYFDTTGMTQSEIDYNMKMFKSIPEQDRAAVVANNERLKKEAEEKAEKEKLKDKDGVPLKPIKTKEDLADLLGTDPANIEMIKE